MPEIIYKKEHLIMQHLTYYHNQHLIPKKLLNRMTARALISRL